MVVRYNTKEEKGFRYEVFQLDSSPSPSLIHDGSLVESLVLEDFDCLLAADGRQHSEGGRQVQTLQLQVPPPDARRETRVQVSHNHTRVGKYP